MRICGIDEAGKGPVLGPMTAAGVAAEDEHAFRGMGIKDSKQLTPKKREQLYTDITESFDWHVVIRTPQEIDQRPGTMNDFTASLHAEAASALRPEKLILDACDVNADRFGVTVLEKTSLPKEKWPKEVISIHKADAVYEIVGAASIVAKVTRDRIIGELNEEYGKEYGSIGSGYPSDAVTVAFLREYIRRHGQAPACARTSWQTVKDLLGAAGQRRLDSFW